MNPRGFAPDLRQWRQFVAVAETLHFGRAALRLSMAQPPLSRAIARLEDGLGARLFDRRGKRVALSAIGHALLPEARAVLAAADRLADLARAAAAGAFGELSLSFVSIVDYSFLPALLRRYRVRHPGVRVSLREATTDVQIAALESAAVDAGIIFGPPPVATPGSAAALSYAPLAAEPLVLALPSALARRFRAGPVSLRALAAQPFIATPRHVAPQLADAVTAVCADAGFAPRIVQEAIQMQTVISLVSAGIGVALVPQSITSLRRPGVVYRPLRGSGPVLEIGLAWRQGNPSAALARFVALAAQSRP
ncbi:MAG: LysR family transcriptional regulator [Burkholderiales bacterium]|nr:LysR family transcriptional regulator [Burkholderiales bacterium]